MEIDIHTLIGEATAYDKKQMLEIKRPKAGLRACLRLPMVKAAH